MAERVLIAPLHWGLGHAARCIPIIGNQLQAGNEVILVAQGGPEALLREHFPSLRFIHIPFPKITYPEDGNMVRHFAFRLPRLFYGIWREHRLLKEIVRKEHITMVISDSRFGLWTRRAHCIYMTHQVHIFSPMAEKLINSLHHWVMSRFDEVWIPDYEKYPGLAGDLSHPKNLPSHARYIGPLSRFSAPLIKRPMRWKYLALISGPEPQRTLFEETLLRDYLAKGDSALLICGLPFENFSTEHRGVKRVSHLNDAGLLEELGAAETVVARSGYSTIMDFHALGITASWIPTPGQTEQLYLAKLHENQNQWNL